MSERGRRPASRLGRLVLAAVAVAVGCSAPAAAAAPPTPAPGSAGSIGLRLVDAPVDTKDDPRARVYIVDHLAPGAVIDRRVEVSNTTGSTSHLVLYPAAATIDGGSFVGAADRTPNDLTTWTSVSPAEADVPAGGRSTATVHIAVPNDAAPGEQYGVVWAEARSAPGGGGVTQVSRVGIRLYVSVGPGGAPASDFAIDTLTASRLPDGRPSVQASVRNSGGRALDMNGTLQLSDGPGGLNAGPFPVTLGTTLATKTTEPVSTVLDKQLPAGPWKARITLRSGLVERSAEAQLTFPEVGAAPAVRVAAARPRWLYPAVAAGVVLLLLLAAGVFRGIRRRRRGQEPPTAQPTPRRPVNTH